MKSYLDRLATEQGICLTRPSPDGVEVPISDATKQKLLGALKVDVDPSTDRSVAKRPANARSSKGIAKSYLPGFLEDERVWGISLQLYELRSERNWGIGDFEDLVRMIEIAASLGADFVGLNPLHAPFLAAPDRCSPYEPSNRSMLNPLYIAVDKVCGFKADSALDKKLRELRQTDEVNYEQVAEIKLSELRRIWRNANDAVIDDQPGFRIFVREGGEKLRLHALFEVISSAMTQQGAGASWETWPAEFQSPDTPAVMSYANRHRDEIDFHIWLQWLTHKQLMHAAITARHAGLRIGLYLDLAVGEAVDGSATWSDRNAYVAGATIGSPPDPYATQGQDWHLAAFRPTVIASGEEPPFRRMLAAAMRYAGAIRIDHAAALRRLFLVPLDCQPDGGAYVNYPQESLMQLLAEASSQYHCLVIGEDLGILPAGLQEDLAEAQILSYRILSYERTDGGFRLPHEYPRHSIACISTHDHQTLACWWAGADIEARLNHGIVPHDVTKQHLKQRVREREDLRIALGMAGKRLAGRRRLRRPAEEELTALVVEAHRFIARTSSVMSAVRLADMTAEERPTNIPGTSRSYPNWKPKLSVPIESLLKVELLHHIADAMRSERPPSSKRNA
ncbi:4-alpha-glucanotransferase [Rhizobium sp. P38BS-XIX]|uniref:4-alpha-glucanotransferase n=1 Tax=Rhizobium sp. P38BS-XIX TaxID=2726740 RepID=UPI0014565913|nr:4-alpha-glucanotransferase [Rhizobium sp. P38BS-XIX]NLR97193.1 4-alpha-glucanotransferase [Rhizobium sp. P38BS-XIX]